MRETTTVAVTSNTQELDAQSDNSMAAFLSSETLQLPPEVQLLVLEHLGPTIEIIEGCASSMQENEVVETHSFKRNGSTITMASIFAYHLIITRDPLSQSIANIEIGFCKRDSSGQFVYAVKALDKKSSLFRYFIEYVTDHSPRRIPFVWHETETETEENFLLRKYLEEAIQAAGGLTQNPMKYIARLAKTSRNNYYYFSPYLKHFAHRELLNRVAYHQLGIFYSVADNAEAHWSNALTTWLQQEAAGTLAANRTYRYEGTLLKILVGNPELLTQQYLGDIQDTALRFWHNPSMIKLALALGQPLVFQIMDQFIKIMLAAPNLSASKRQVILVEKQQCLNQLEAWEYPQYLLQNKPTTEEMNTFDKGICVYHENDNVIAVVVYGFKTYETFDLKQCFLCNGLTQDRIKQELNEIKWPDSWEKNRVSTQLPAFIQTTIDHYRQHPNGLTYTLDNLGVKGLQVQDADWLANNPDEKARYKREAEEFNNYYFIIKMKDGEVESCWLGLRDPQTGLYREIPVPQSNQGDEQNTLFGLAKDLHNRLGDSRDEFNNSLSFYITREPQDLQAAREFLETQKIETNLTQQATRVDLFQILGCLLNQIDYWLLWSLDRSRENYLARVCLFLRLASPFVVQLWLSEEFKWWEPDFDARRFTRGRMHTSADALALSHTGFSIFPASPSWGSKNYAAFGRLASFVASLVAGGRRVALLNSQLQTQFLAEQNLKSTLKMR